MEVALINCHYPVTHNSFVLQWGVAVQKIAGPARGQGREARRDDEPDVRRGLPR